MKFTKFGSATQILTRGGPGTGHGTDRWTRIPPGHPEGYLEGFANLYSDAADLISGIETEVPLPDINAALEGMWFISACQKSSANDGAWCQK